MVPAPASARFPNIKASLDDGFFVLAEQQARGALRSEPREVDERDAALLLAHALWGQKRYSEMIDLLARYNGEPGYVYWRARAYFELKRFDTALQTIASVASQPASPKKSATVAIKSRVMIMARGRPTPPNLLMLICNQDVPNPIKPNPKNQPSLKACLGVAGCHSQKSSARLNMAI